MQEHVSDSSRESQEPVLAHESTAVTCLLCGEEVPADKDCEAEECPMVAARRMRIAALDTPFELGI
jgi:hypothetical protein